MNRKIQKQKTRRSIIDAAYRLLDSQKSLSSISLREVAREAGIAPTSFYRHFKDIDELGLTLVDEAGLALRQLMRKARSRIEEGGSVIHVSVTTFIEYVSENADVFRLLLREHTGTSPAFRAAVAREIQHFIEELTDYILGNTEIIQPYAQLQAEAMVRIVFSAGAEAIDASKVERKLISNRVETQLRFILLGAMQLSTRKLHEYAIL